MERDILRALLNTEGIGAVIDRLITSARPLGDVEHWKFSRSLKHHVIRFFIELDDPTKHQSLAQKLGGRVIGNEVCLEIRLAHGQSRHGQSRHDRRKIDLKQEYEVRYWTKELGVSEEDLKRAVQIAGNQVERVKQHLAGSLESR